MGGILLSSDDDGVDALLAELAAGDPATGPAPCLSCRPLSGKRGVAWREGVSGG